MTAPPPAIVEIIGATSSPYHVPQEVRVNGVPLAVEAVEVVTDYGVPTRVTLDVLPESVFYRKSTDEHLAEPSERLEDRVKRLEADLLVAQYAARKWEDNFRTERAAYDAERSRRRSLEGRIYDALEGDE